MFLNALHCQYFAAHFSLLKLSTPAFALDDPPFNTVGDESSGRSLHRRFNISALYDRASIIHPLLPSVTQADGGVSYRAGVYTWKHTSPRMVSPIGGGSHTSRVIVVVVVRVVESKREPQSREMMHRV